MAVKFFARFNLHNSICAKPISVALLKAFLTTGSDAELEDMLREIDEIQSARVERLREDRAYPWERLRGKKVVFIGDSITSDNLGYRETVTRSAALCATDGSVSGGTSSMLLHTAKALIERMSPDFVSIMIGSNDSISIERAELHQVGIDEYRRNVAELLRWSQKSGARVLLFEIPPILEDRFEKSYSGQGKLHSNAAVRTYNEVLQALAKENGIPLLSNAWLSEQDEYFESDGIHLSLLGQERFARKWLEAAIN